MTLERRTPLKRTRLRARSTKRENEAPTRRAVVEQAIARDRGCVAADLVREVRCGGPLDPHEVIPRSAWRAGYLDLDNVRMVCRRHHDWIDENELRAHTLGLHGYSYETPHARQRVFWSHVDVRGDDECWPWTAARDRNGYGVTSWRSTNAARSSSMQSAHRVAFILAGGVVADDQDVMHACDNRPCCNPRHLAAGSHAENLAQMSARGRSLRGSKHPNGLDVATVTAIRAALAAGLSHRAIAETYGVNKSTVCRISTGERHPEEPL